MSVVVARGRPVSRWRAQLRALGWQVTLLARNDRPVARTGHDSEAAHAPALTAGGASWQPETLVDELYQRHARSVLAYLCARLPALADAEDALADVFEAALGACGEGEAPGIGWLMRVASRRVADFYRQRQRRPVAPLANDSGEHPAAGPGHDPEARVLRAEEHGELRALVARLPDDQREALALRFGAGLRSREIAAVLGRSDEATRALLSRALRHLRKEWAK